MNWRFENSFQSAVSLNETANINKIRINFILVRVRETPIHNVDRLIDRVLKIGKSSDAKVEAIMSSVVLLTYTNLIEDDNMSKDRKKLVWRLKEEMGADIAIVHGCGWGLKDNLNHSGAGVLGIKIPHFFDLIKELGVIRLNGESEKLF